MKSYTLHRSFYIFLLVMSIQLTLYLFLTNRANALTPPGHVHTMMLVDTYYPDIIRQSKFGRWAVIDDHTTLPVPEVRGYVFFILAGKIAALFNIDPVYMYELLRITGAILVFLATYILITQLLPPTLHILAIVFTFVIDIAPIAPNIFVMPNLATNFALPHHLWAEAMGLVLLYILFKAIRTPTLTLSVAIIILAFIGTVTLPSYFVILVACVFAPWLLYALVTKTFKHTFLPILIATLAILAAGLWIKYEFDKGPPWNALTAFEKSWWTTKEVIIPFIQSMTVFAPFIAALFILIPTNWSRWSKQIRQSVMLTASWSFLPIALIYIAQAPWFPIANGRIASDVSRVPFGILSAIGAWTVWQKIRNSPVLRTLALSLFTLFITMSLYFSVTYFQQMLSDQDRAVSDEPYSWWLYPTNNLWNGIMSLKNLPAYSHLMIAPVIGELTTTYLPIRVYQAHPLSFVDWSIRRNLSIQFYSGTMDINDIRKLFRENAISYVFYGPEEKNDTITPTFYPDILEVIYQNPEVTIYKVKNL